MIPLELLSTCLLGLGGLFFIAGTVGLLRFPDVHTRLHALSKADNVGLGLVVAGLMLQAEAPAVAIKLFAIWMLVLLASGTSCYLIASEALSSGEIQKDESGGAGSRN